MAYLVIALTPYTESIIPLKIDYLRGEDGKVFLNLANKAQLSSGPGKIMIPFDNAEYKEMVKAISANNNIEEFIKDLVRLDWTILFISMKLNDVGLYMNIIDRLNCVKIQKPTKRAVQVEARTNLRYPVKRGRLAFYIRKARLHVASWFYDLAAFIREDRESKKIYATTFKGGSNNLHS